MPSPPYSPGGRLIECTTRSEGRRPTGRSSWFGDGTKRQGRSRPSGPSFIFPDAQALHAIAQLPEGDAEKLGRRRTVEAGLAERLEDRLALDGIQILRERFGSGRRRRAAAGRGRWRAQAQVIDANLFAGRESERSLEDVLELADIAREVVARELGE